MLKEATISERKIVNAFIELLEESSLEQISITDIIKKAKSQQTDLLLLLFK